MNKEEKRKELEIIISEMQDLIFQMKKLEETPTEEKEDKRVYISRPPLPTKSIEDWFNLTNADGIDFVPRFTGIGDDDKEIYQRNTRKEIVEEKVSFPESSYMFWKVINNLKYYIAFVEDYEVVKVPKNLKPIYIGSGNIKQDIETFNADGIDILMSGEDLLSKNRTILRRLTKEEIFALEDDKDFTELNYAQCSSILFWKNIDGFIRYIMLIME